MKFLRFFIIGILSLCFNALMAQDHCYETLRQKGIQLYNQGDYSAASKNFETAKLCTDLPATNDLDSWLEKCVIVVRLSMKEVTFDASGTEEQCVEVSTNAKSFKVGSTPAWCKVTQEGKTLHVTCEDNFTVAPRETKVVITAGGRTASLNVVQRSADLEMEFQPESLLFSSQPETKQVVVTTNALDWQVETSPAWLLTERKDDTLFVASTKNASSAYREADVIISVAGETFNLPVKQQPGDTIIDVNKSELVFASDSSVASVNVSSNISAWSFEPSEKWIMMERSADSVIVAVPENTSVFSRHGFLRFRAGHHALNVPVHQEPHVSQFVRPVSELQSIEQSSKDSILVTSVPSELRVYIDDTLSRLTPFAYHVDYEHHSLQMGFERRDIFFNDKQSDVVFEPGLRFAEITFSSPKVFGLKSGFVSANSFGGYAHAQFSTPYVTDFLNDSIGLGGYHLTLGAVYQPIQYVGIYAGLGAGAVQGRPHACLDYEMGVMGFFKNITMSMGFHSMRLNSTQKQTKFLFGIGGYLKRYYDPDFGYCSSDSRRWWSVNYMFRPAMNGKGVMFSDLGHEKMRVYLKALYLHPSEEVKSVDGAVGVVFTPIAGSVDRTWGVSAEVNVKGLEKRFQGIGAEVGAILNLWRIPITFMLHDSNVFGERHLMVDFGVGFHFGDFKRSSYK